MNSDKYWDRKYRREQMINRIVGFGSRCADWLTVFLIVLIPISLIGAPMIVAMSNGWSFFAALIGVILFYAIIILVPLCFLAFLGAIFDDMPKGTTVWFFWWF